MLIFYKLKISFLDSCLQSKQFRKSENHFTIFLMRTQLSAEIYKI